jgi:hypothetical protein
LLLPSHSAADQRDPRTPDIPWNKKTSYSAATILDIGLDLIRSVVQGYGSVLSRDMWSFVAQRPSPERAFLSPAQIDKLGRVIEDLKPTIDAVGPTPTLPAV